MGRGSIATTLRGTLLAAALAGAACAPAASAGEASGQFGVSVTIVASCRLTVEGGNLPFGVVRQGASASAQSSIGVRCSANQPYAIGFDYGQHAEGNQRRMSDGSAAAAYQLYADASHRSPLGPIGSANAVHGMGTGAAQAIPVYGQLTVDPGAPPGAYSDTVRLTVTW